MIKRIVKMDLLPGREAIFFNIFEDVKNEIRAQEGCMGLELWQSGGNEHISVWTISLWHSTEALDRYRSSPLFKTTWSAVKPLFSTKAQAWTLTRIQ